MRRLTDLYKRGKPLTLNDGKGEPLEVYIQKLNPVEREKVNRRANSERAKVLALRRYPDSDEYQEIWVAAEELDRDGMESLVVAEAMVRRRAAIEAQIAFSDEWSKDGYLDGLRDSWEDGLKFEFAKNPDHEEASRVFNELKRFAEEVDTQIAAAEEAERKDLAGKSDETLRDECLKLLLNARADQQWLRGYRLEELYLSVRDPQDHNKLYFESIDEVDSLMAEIKTLLLTEVRNLTVEPSEGKDSEGEESSSPSSEQPSGEAL